MVATRFRARATPTEADLDAALELAATTPQEMLTLAEIALPFGQHGEAETEAFADQLYRQLTAGRQLRRARARVQPQFLRRGAAARWNRSPPPSFPPPSAAQVLLLSPGQITRPLPISGGVAIIKLVSIKEVRPDPSTASADDPEAREQLRQQLFTERITSFGQGYLQELLGDALIVER